MTSSEAVALRSTNGELAPPELAAGLALFLELPASVQDSYAEVLEANLGPVVDDRAETFIKRYCRRHEIEPERLAPSVRALRFLFTEGVTAGTDREAFIDDVKALLPPAPASVLLGRLLPLFDAAFPRLKHAAAFLSVAEHGRVVRAVRWRVDVIKASDHSARIDLPVATLTFQYQEGPNAGQASYQLLPEQAAELQKALASIVG